MELLNINAKIDINDDKTNIVHAFNVPQGVKKLVIDYSYSPKTVEDDKAAIEIVKSSLQKYNSQQDANSYLPVKNLVTLSLDDESSYRGAAHRQADVQHHEIGENSASAGFLAGKIGAGQWKVWLNVHCAACPISYELKITGEEEE